jgi:Predicted membrane protein (DUF2142)
MLTWLSATTAVAIVGCTWAFATARYGGPDEPAHVLRAAAVAHGDLLGRQSPDFDPGFRIVTAPASLASGDPACFRHDATITAACAKPATQTSDTEVATSAGTAPPWYYAVVGALARWASHGTNAMAYRMAATLGVAAIVGYALGRARRFGAGGWLIAAFTPSAWFLSGVVGTSGIEIALIALVLVEAVNAHHRSPSAASLARISVPLAACLLLRPAAVIDIVLVGLFVWPTIVRPMPRRRIAALIAPLIVVVVATLAWNQWSGLVFSDRRTADVDSFAAAVRSSIGGVPTTVRQAIGALGWNEFSAPVIAQGVWLVIFAVAIWRTVATRGCRWHVGWLAAALLVPTVVEVVIHRRVGAVWQGRYSIPFAMGGVFYAARAGAPTRRVGVCLAVGSALMEVLTLWHTLRRYMVGLNGSLILRRATWSPPLNPWLLLGVNAVAMAWLATVAWGSDDVAEHVDDDIGRTGVVEHRQLAT